MHIREEWVSGRFTATAARRVVAAYGSQEDSRLYTTTTQGRRGDYKRKKKSIWLLEERALGRRSGGTSISAAGTRTRLLFSLWQLPAQVLILPAVRV